MIVKLIKTEADHAEALARLGQLMDAAPDTPEGDELKLLATLIEAYEKERCPLPPPDPVEAIKFRMDQSNLKKKDLVRYIGSIDKVTGVLNGKRPLNLKMIRALHMGLGIPAESLLAQHAVPKRMANLPGRQAKTA